MKKVLKFYNHPLVNNLTNVSKSSLEDEGTDRKIEDIVENGIFNFQREILSKNAEEKLKDSKELIQSNLRNNNFFDDKTHEIEINNGKEIKFTHDFKPAISLSIHNSQRKFSSNNTAKNSKSNQNNTTLRKTHLRKNFFFKSLKGGSENVFSHN